MDKELKKAIENSKPLPRKIKRKIWKAMWMHRRNVMEGNNRIEKRRYWRNLWRKMTVIN